MVQQTFQPFGSVGVSNQNGNNNNKKGARFLSAKAVLILNKWFQENRDYPYPDEATTDRLAHEAGKLKLKI
jgi:hypothetical protein